MGPKKRKGILGNTFLKVPAIVEQLSKEDPEILKKLSSRTYKAVQAHQKTHQEQKENKQVEVLTKKNQRLLASKSPRLYCFSKRLQPNEQSSRTYKFKHKQFQPSSTQTSQGSTDVLDAIAGHSRIDSASQAAIFQDDNSSATADNGNIDSASQAAIFQDDNSSATADNGNIDSASQSAILQDDNYSAIEDNINTTVYEGSVSPEDEPDVFTTFKTIKIDSLTAYELELRKTKKIIPVDDHFLTVVIPDFNEKKSKLTEKRFLSVSRKCFFADEESLRWLYGCSCTPFEKIFINSLALDNDYLQEEKDTCLHINVVRKLVTELDSWKENEDPLDFIGDRTSRVNEVSDIDFCDNTVFVVVNDSAGVVSNNGSKLFCCVCETTFCSHCNHVRELKGDASSTQPDFLVDFFKDTVTPKTTSWRKAESWKKIPYNVKDPKTLKPPSTYLPEAESIYHCQDTDNLCRECDGPLFESNSKQIFLICKSYYLECEVTNKTCHTCRENYPYDGLEHSILNMGKLLIHHSVLRDYMLHFLHGNSCTIHGYYQVMIASQEQNGNIGFSNVMNYNDFRCSWYSFLSLLDISLEENAECQICGPAPEIVVCDATGLGHQRKFLALGLSEEDEELVNPRTS